MFMTSHCSGAGSAAPRSTKRCVVHHSSTNGEDTLGSTCSPWCVCVCVYTACGDACSQESGDYHNGEVDTIKTSEVTCDNK